MIPIYPPGRVLRIRGRNFRALRAMFSLPRRHPLRSPFRRSLECMSCIIQALARRLRENRVQRVFFPLEILPEFLKEL